MSFVQSGSINVGSCDRESRIPDFIWEKGHESHLGGGSSVAGQPGGRAKTGGVETMW